MAVKIGTTDIATVGKIKIGSTDITKVYQGTTQIWPAGVTYYAFCTSWVANTGASGACSTSLITDTLYTTNSSGVVNVGNIVYYLSSGVYYPYDFSEVPFVSYNESSVRKVLEISTDGTGTILSKTTCGATSFDLYNADVYDCSTLSPSGTTIVAFPSGTSVNFARYYTSPITTGEFAYKPTSTASSGSGIILDTTPYLTVILACTVTF